MATRETGWADVMVFMRYWTLKTMDICCHRLAHAALIHPDSAKPLIRFDRLGG
jgi:hypothetical protein